LFTCCLLVNTPAPRHHRTHVDHPPPTALGTLRRRLHPIDYESARSVLAGPPYPMTSTVCTQFGAILAASCGKGAAPIPKLDTSRGHGPLPTLCKRPTVLVLRIMIALQRRGHFYRLLLYRLCRQEAVGGREEFAPGRSSSQT
jgi:hypothetical protein